MFGSLTREEKVLRGISREMKILEIGPSFSPMVPKSAGWTAFTLDHADKANLTRKYEALGVDCSKIEEVDFVWKGGAVHDCVPEAHHGTFDAIVACHVLEHIPDPISFFESLRILLTENGIVSLVLPDKRYTFDFLRPLTITSDLIVAHEEKRDRHSRAAILSERLNAITSDGEHVWATWLPLRRVDYANVFDLAVAPRPEQASGDYVDCHGSTFTPSSFDLIALELGALNLLDFRVEFRFRPWGCEFYRTLRVGAAASPVAGELTKRRLSLHRQIAKELAQRPFINDPAGSPIDPEARGRTRATLRRLRGFVWRRFLAE